MRLDMRTYSFSKTIRCNRLFLIFALVPLFLYVGERVKFMGLNSIGLGGHIQPTLAQSLRPEGAAFIIYQRLPFIALENQYRRKDTGEIDKDHTLISRLIRYNEDTKKRSSYRIDWQLTIADYLGANESIDADRYPGSATLQSNPTKGDIVVIGKLTLAQRRSLIALLTELYAPPQETRPTVKPTSPEPSQREVTPPRPGLAKPGDANLLLPK
jgi:hypothetical protein